MDATIEVTWEDGQVTRHEISGLPRMSAGQIAELLEHDLASYIDADEMPVSSEGFALGWRSVGVVTIDARDAPHGFVPYASSAAASYARDRWAMLAALQEHRAHRTRYERQLNIPASSAYSHQRGTRWLPEQMCADQWQGLQAIRAQDRGRKRRTRERVPV